MPPSGSYHGDMKPTFDSLSSVNDVARHRHQPLAARYRPSRDRPSGPSDATLRAPGVETLLKFGEWLKGEVYKGTFWYNCIDSRTRKPRPEASLNNDKAGLKRLYAAIEKGIVDIDDPQFAQQVADAKLRVADGELRIREMNGRRMLHSMRISGERVDAFSRQVRERLRNSDPTFRRAWLHLFVDRVVIGPDEIRILGPNQALADGLVQGEIKAGTIVPSFDRKWRAAPGDDENYVYAIAL